MEYFISIYPQGVQGYTATRSDVLVLPLLVGIILGNILGGLEASRFGYYNHESKAPAVALRTAMKLCGCCSGIDRSCPSSIPSKRSSHKL
ncbi:hypothetical protein F5B18DRAFT_597568, partial [Nemania serpens]